MGRILGKAPWEGSSTRLLEKVSREGSSRRLLERAPREGSSRRLLGKAPRKGSLGRLLEKVPRFWFSQKPWFSTRGFRLAVFDSRFSTRVVSFRLVVFDSTRYPLWSPPSPPSRDLFVYVFFVGVYIFYLCLLAITHRFSML